MTYFAKVLPVELERLFSSSTAATGKMPTGGASPGRVARLSEPEPLSKHAAFMPLLGSAMAKTFDMGTPR